MTYNVFGGTLNLVLSIYLSIYIHVHEFKDLMTIMMMNDDGTDNLSSGRIFRTLN